METLETERQPAKPPLRPKPPMPKRAQDDGWLMGGKGRPARPPVPAKRPASEFPAGEAPQGWGNVRKIRERFDKAAESPETARVGATKEKQPLAVRRSESAREVARDAPPVPKARRKRAVSRETSAKRSEDQTPAVPAITEPPESQEPSSDHRGESETVQTDAPGETVGEGHCPISCPCLCHRGRPGMVLVWRPASESTAADPGLTDSSLSDSAESDDKPFAYVFTVNETPNGCPAETAPEEAGAEDDGYLCLLPSALGEIPSDGGLGPGAERAGSSPVPPGAAPLPKPPRRHKPPAQTSPDTAPRLPARREARLRQSEALPPPPPATASVLQRYSTADLDKFSKCVDQLNLHVRGLVLPGRGPSTLMPPSPTVTRSAPPSPTEKHVQPTYDQVDAGEEESVRIGLYELHLDAPLSRSLKSEDRNSKGWESRFESEPLYQTYRDTVIHKQIKRQTLMRDSSKTSDDYTYESIPLAVESDRATSSLWQNLNAVRQSGILEGLSPEERKQQESMFEVLTSEASYLRSLNILIDHFMHSRVLNDSIILRDKKTLFSSIVRVAEVSASFLKDLEERVDENIKITDVCDIIHRHAQQNFQIYIDYVRNQFYQEQKYSQLMEENAHFAAAVVRLQELPQCQRLPLMSFLLLPFQRITRIKMLIENILQRSEVGSINEETASKALSVVSKIIEDCNREVGIMKQMEEMIHIMKKLEFDKLKAIPIISKLRHLEKQGELSEVVHRGNRFGVKPKVTLLYLFLFNDLLLVTVKKSGDRYQVLDYAHRSLVEVQESSSNWPGTSAANCFVLTLLENRLGKQSERLLKAPTQSDRHRWMNALSSGRYVNPEDAKDDKVYECWDCPQVQCLIPYTAQQADELSLEAADIINVTKKSSEGWYEGSKLSNGQKGWFPSDRVQEITNEHVRRRNLRERYRLLQAAQHLHDKQDGDGAGGERANTSL